MQVTWTESQTNEKFILKKKADLGMNDLGSQPSCHHGAKTSYSFLKRLPHIAEWVSARDLWVS